jgi:prolyl-tRNA synthetase
MTDDISSTQLTAKKAEFSDWWQQILRLADILDQRYELKGMFVWRGHGYKTMMNIKRSWDRKFEEAGIEECYFPLIVPVEYCKKNESWWEKFSQEGYKVIAGKDDKLQGALRPTGEPAMYPMFSLWVRSKNDLPIRIYETVSSFRYETKSPRPLIRDMEITVWHEIHTAHATSAEAESEMQLHMQLWDEIWSELCLPTWKIQKPSWECFPGAIGGIEYYNTMPTGKVLETGSVNNLGQAYAKKFDIAYQDVDGERKYAWQICTGVGARLLAAVIAIHGDDRGIILPPKIAPIQAVIVPIVYKGTSEQVMERANLLYRELKAHLKVVLDDRDESAGRKFYDWEIKGVPVRIEIGPKDIAQEQVTLVRRDTGLKRSVPIVSVARELQDTFADIEKTLLARATEMLEKQMCRTSSVSEISVALSHGDICVAPWCASETCFDVANTLEPGVEAIGSAMKEEAGVCFHCGKQSRKLLYVAKTY